MVKGGEDGVIVHSYGGRKVEGRGGERRDEDRFYGRGGIDDL